MYLLRCAVQRRRREFRSAGPRTRSSGRLGREPELSQFSGRVTRSALSARPVPAAARTTDRQRRATRQPMSAAPRSALGASPTPGTHATRPSNGPCTVTGVRYGGCAGRGRPARRRESARRAHKCRSTRSGPRQQRTHRGSERPLCSASSVSRSCSGASSTTAFVPCSTPAKQLAHPRHPHPPPRSEAPQDADPGRILSGAERRPDAGVRTTQIDACGAHVSSVR